MWPKQQIFKIFFLFIALFVFTSHAQADDKRLVINFDKNNICCIMNGEILAKELEKMNGISAANYNLDLRKIVVYFDPEKVNVIVIVDKVSKITEVPKQFILTEPDA